MKAHYNRTNKKINNINGRDIIIVTLVNSNGDTFYKKKVVNDDKQIYELIVELESNGIDFEKAILTNRKPIEWW